MTVEKAMDTLSQIITESGLDEIISVSRTPNDLADLMVYSSAEKKDYLATLGEELFPFSVIGNIFFHKKKRGWRCHIRLCRFLLSDCI